jgi:predicted nucleic acid-binding Zn ribbon protein
MSDVWQHCLVCGVFMPPEQTVYEVRHFFDPVPPKGYACSERCARQAEEQSRMRSYLTIDLLNKGGG